MLKKFLWLIIAVVFLCSPLWALEDNPWNDYLFAFSDQQSEAAQTLASTPVVQPASPLDICPNTNACFNPPPGLSSWPLSSTSAIYAFQQPQLTCPPTQCNSVYPFEVKAVHLMLRNIEAIPCIVVLQPAILTNAGTSNCPFPGTILCQGPPVQVQVPANSPCFEVILPLQDSCCVDASYFACVSVLSNSCTGMNNGPRVCLDQSCIPCCNYADVVGFGVHDACGFFGSPGDFAIWTDGLLSCQSKCVPPPVDTLRNHFKTWRIITQPFPQVVFSRDQFQNTDLILDTIDFLSNPTVKDTSFIKRPNDHLTWYRAKGQPISDRVEYVNQFESTKVFIDTVKYLLLPTQKDPHPRPDSLLGHYTAYKIRKPVTFRRSIPIQIQDQFDLAPEMIDSLIPRYFLTPSIKNNEPRFDPDTHYVAYEIFPKGITSVTSTLTFDQFGQHFISPILRSELLLVPTRKDTFVVCTYKPNDCNGDGKVDLADIVCDVNVVFHGFPPPVPKCRCDSNCDGKCDLVDIVYKRNYVFGGGPQPVPCKECCKPLP